MANDLYFEAEKQKLPAHAKVILSELKKLGCNSVTYSLGPDNLPIISISGTPVITDAVKVYYSRSYGSQNPGSYRIIVSSSITPQSYGFPLRINGIYKYQLIAQRVKQFQPISDQPEKHSYAGKD
jgi:hypothetical protein